MFLSFEGIDGAGKTTVSAAVGERLRAAGHPVLFVDRHTARSGEPYVDEQLAALSERLWTATRSAPIHRLGELHWILLTASFYAALGPCVVEPALARGDVVVVDSWFYKFAARVVSNGRRDADEVLGYFRDVLRPDAVFLLDVSPAVAAARLGTFTTGETGLPDGSSGPPAAAFVEYQQRIRSQLRDQADRFGWTVVTADGPLGTVVDRVLDALGRRLGPAPVATAVAGR